MSETSKGNGRAAPDVIYEAAIVWINQGQQFIEKSIGAISEVNGAFESAFSTTRKGVLDCGSIISETMRANTNTAFETTRDLMGVKSLPEAVEISAAGVRKQFGALTAQNQEMGALSLQLMTETIKPIADSLPKLFDANALSRSVR